MSETWYMLVCLECDQDMNLPMPFASAEERGKWCAAHRKGTGHDRWFCPDVKTGSNVK